MYNKIIDKIRLWKSIFFLLIIVFSGCGPKKDTEFVIVLNEAKSIINKLKDSPNDLTNKALEDAISNSSVDGIIRWRLTTEPAFLIQSSKKHPFQAGSSVFCYWYISKDLKIVRK